LRSESIWIAVYVAGLALWCKLLRSESIWIAVYVAGLALWMLVAASIFFLFPAEIAFNGNIDLSIPASLLIGINIFYLFLSNFVAIIYLVGIHKVKSYQIRMSNSIRIADLDQELCTIIIPAKNEEAVIRASVLSCLKQTYRNIEVLVVSHNSTDRTSKEAQVDDSRVTVVDLVTAEAGKAIALNYGVTQARGKYILVIDADHRLSDNFIEDALPVLAFGPYAAVQGNVRSLNRNYNLLSRLASVENDLWTEPFLSARHLLGRRCPLCGTGYIIKKDVLLKIGMFSNNLVEDAELTYRLIRNGYKIAFVPLSLVYGEEPVSFDGLFKQRARWNRGFLSLLSHKVEPKDFLGNLYWIFPGISYSNFLIVGIIAFASIHTIIFGVKPYQLTYLPLALWFLCITLNYGILLLLLLRNSGLMRKRYASLLPLYLFYAQYMFPASIKTFFVKSWHTTKTVHGFNEPKNNDKESGALINLRRQKM
jgi:cellulose synthase/poly-beta-1,6-N-acetylglucosamine synthase-like glycosyltransferase